ncbi:2-hydroxy-palmitic acid dioxygenase Mpo1-like protein [Dioscorea alata]|uniref:2-hydroxy-palmitic acid dioxygenase Mpo1-like protein n=1 Tax=Dioscorea alata TaxID=55571 RepID=A0ACB7TWT6_DIOAL|nr:2-hydroxy-palmitic acid dioxygenase Mpo1-like protein [Dioscorea alata]
MAKGLFDLENNFAFYGAYHSNPTNVLIHMLFVWPIFYTSLLLLQFTPLLLHVPFGFGGGDALLPLNFAFVFALIYALFYVLMDKKAGSLAALLCMLCWLGSDANASRLGFSLAWKVVLAAQLFCWTGQFIGHGVFEKRAPALLDNLSQAFLMAPFFVLLEALQQFGYEPYPGFHASVHAKIDAARKEWEAKKAKKTI